MSWDVGIWKLLRLIESGEIFHDNFNLNQIIYHYIYGETYYWRP